MKKLVYDVTVITEEDDICKRFPSYQRALNFYTKNRDYKDDCVAVYMNSHHEGEQDFTFLAEENGVNYDMKGARI